ncbi:MAG: hypothetical protein DHS20C01_01820 [marine bacterium B5-7]|nr:MAG: hypothetical protein DHS20C01_01820 [marine bacterium B5-7]
MVSLNFVEKIGKPRAQPTIHVVPTSLLKSLVNFHATAYFRHHINYSGLGQEIGRIRDFLDWTSQP